MVRTSRYETKAANATFAAKLRKKLKENILKNLVCQFHSHVAITKKFMYIAELASDTKLDTIFVIHQIATKDRGNPSNYLCIVIYIKL